MLHCSVRALDVGREGEHATAQGSAKPESPLEAETITSGVVTGVVTREVTREVARLLAHVRGEMTRRELQSLLALRAEENFRQKYLMPALAGGYIEPTIPEKPTSRLQKYRLTAKGHKMLREAGSPRK